MSLQLDFSPVTTLKLGITVAVILVLFVGILTYLIITTRVYGVALWPYFAMKLKKNGGIIQETIYEDTILKPAEYKNGEFFVHGKRYVPQSITYINGTPTIMEWCVNPPLPELYIKFLKYFVENKITSIKEIGNLKDSKIIIDKQEYSLNDFLALHQKVVDKAGISVTPEDIINFDSRYIDEHAKKSIIEQEVTIQQKKLRDNAFQKYAFYIVGLALLGGLILIAWKIKNAGA